MFMTSSYLVESENDFQESTVGGCVRGQKSYPTLCVASLLTQDTSVGLFLCGAVQPSATL